MSGYLKGNYSVKTKKNSKKKLAKKSKDSLSEIFEHKAFEKLGGSIAFVMKSDKFVWSPDEKTK